MKINFSKNIYLNQIIFLFIIVNFISLMIIFVVASYHNDHEEKIIKTFVKNIREKELNMGMTTSSAIKSFVKSTIQNKAFEISLFDTTGDEIYSSSKFLKFFKASILKIQKQLSQSEFYILKHYRFTKYDENRYLAFKFEIPPPPRFNIFSWNKDDLEQGPPKLFILMFFMTNTVILIGLVISQKILGGFVSKQSRDANIILTKIASGDTGERLFKTNIPSVDDLVNSFNSMIAKIEEDIEKLKNKDKEINDLVQEISHDLKTPLTSISLIAQNIEKYFKHHQPGEIEKKMEIVSSEVNYASKMIESLLFISTISLEKSTSEIVDLSEVLEFEYDFAQDRYPQREIDLKTQQGIQFNANEVLIKRFIRNLLDNALKYSEQYVAVSLTQTSKMIEFRVENDGQEIKDKNSYGLRDKSRKIDTSDGLNISMGLGTVIIYKIVQKYNAHLEIADRAQGGTIINIEFTKG